MISFTADLRYLQAVRYSLKVLHYGHVLIFEQS